MNSNSNISNNNNGGSAINSASGSSKVLSCVIIFWCPSFYYTCNKLSYCIIFCAIFKIISLNELHSIWPIVISTFPMMLLLFGTRFYSCILVNSLKIDKINVIFLTDQFLVSFLIFHILNFMIPKGRRFCRNLEKE